MSFQERFIEFINREKLCQAGDKLLLAVSGGLDSVVMCHLFVQSGYQVGVAHCNFNLREKESDLDEQFVRKLTEKEGLEFFSTRFDTQRYASDHHLSIQEAARDLRYGWFEQLRQEHQFNHIVTAHHLNDSLETLLINFFKGTGISGLHGIVSRQGRVIRPLLFALREEISVYARINKLEFREDSSNLSPKYLRNQVRLELIPQIKKLFPEAEQALLGNIQRFGEVEILYRQRIDSIRKMMLEKTGAEWRIGVLKLQKSEVRSTIAYELLSPFGFSPGQTREVLKLLDSEPGKIVSSSTHRIIRDRKWLIITPLTDYEGGYYLIEAPDRQLKVSGGRFNLAHSEEKQGGSAASLISSDVNKVTLDLGELEFPLKVRRWKTGDYFYPLGMGRKKKKLSRLFIDKKLPKSEKEKVWVLESGSRIAWVVGIQLDERFKIKDSTRQVLRISFS